MNLFEQIDAHTNLLPSHGTLFHYPAFLSPEQANNIYNRLYHETPWQQYQIKIFGRLLDQPRLTAWYGIEGTSYSYSGLKLAPLPFTPTLWKIKNLIEEKAGMPFNSVLMNLYRNGNDSMGWHADDERELGLNPCIASLSIGSTRKFKIKHREIPHYKMDLPLENGSLLLMGGEMQHHWLHAIPKEPKIGGARINLTFRNILSA